MNVSESPTLLGEATPYTYIGDSHSGAIGTLVFNEGETSNIIVTRPIGIWRLVPRNFLGSDQCVGELVVNALRVSGALHSLRDLPPLEGLRPVTTIYGHEPQQEYLGVTESANTRPYVLMTGEIATRYILDRFTLDRTDFNTPFDVSNLDRLPPYEARRVVSVEEFFSFLAAELSALFKALKILRGHGLRTLFLHALPPPTVEDERCEHVLHKRTPARLRYKIAMAVNYLYRAVCADLDVGFVDTWPLVTENDLLRPEFFLDGIHLNREHSVLSVREVHRLFQERGDR
jgi:hypothetical protein